MTQEKEEKQLIDWLKPQTEASAEIPAITPEMMEEFDVLELMARMIKEEEGVEYSFALTAGAMWPIENWTQHVGIKRVHMRHEQAATFAADAYGRITGRPGLCIIGPGTGMTNSTTGLAQGLAAQAPTVVLVGEMAMMDDNRWQAQGVTRAEDVYRGVSKWVTRVANPTAVLFEVKRAFRDAVTPPQGSCVVGLPMETTLMGCRQPRVMLEAAYTPGFLPRTYETMENPALVEKAMRWLFEAERPALVVGEGIHYDHGVEELKEFVELTGIPTHCRRQSRGAISEYHPLNCYGRARGRVMRRSDRSLVMGLRLAYLENQGMPPFWNGEGRFIQAQACRQNVHLYLPTEYELIGNMKMLLRQMIDCVKAMGITKPPEKWDEWRKFVVDTKEEYYSKTIERTKGMFGKMPLHPDLAGRLMAEFLRDELQDDYIAVIDGFTASSYFTDWQMVRYPAHVMDASETIGIGHSPGMAIGAALATNRSKPLFAIMGDGAVGAGGMDIETAVRWEIPCVFCHENNNTMVTGGWNYFASKFCTPTGNPMLDSWQTLPNIRYDRMFKEFGCHTEFVEKDAELKPALKRAFDFVKKESKPAFVEVFVDPDVLQEIWAGMLTAGMGNIPWDELPEEGQKLIEAGGMVNLMYAQIVHPSWQPHLFKF